MELDIDFENYSVEETRKTEVKSFVELLKAEAWVADLKTLLAEYGTAVEQSKEQGGLFATLDTSKNSKQFLVDPATLAPDGTPHPAIGLLVETDGTVLKMSFENDCLMEVSFLPKANDFAVLFINEPKFETLKEKMLVLAEFVKEAKSKKSSRNAEWKARFEA